MSVIVPSFVEQSRQTTDGNSQEQQQQLDKRRGVSSEVSSYAAHARKSGDFIGLLLLRLTNHR